MGYDVVNKGKLSSPLTEAKGRLEQYLIIKDGEQKFLVLKMSNTAAQRLTAVRLMICQKDARGLSIDVSSVDCGISNGFADSTFTLKDKIELKKECADVLVKIVALSYGNYVYSLNGDNLQLNYEKQEREQVKTDYSKALKGKERSVSARKFKTSVAVCLVMFVMIALSAVFAYSHLLSFANSNSTFSHAGVYYAFEGADKSLNSGVYAVGAKSGTKSVVIPEKIKGHTVTHISSSAFRANKNIVSLTVKGALEIPESTFYGCVNLKTVKLEKAVRIGESAFSGCINLETVITANSQDVLQIREGAFNGCTKLKKVEINQFVDYTFNPDFLNGCFNVESLSLMNFNYSFENNEISYEGGKQTVSELFGLSYASGPMLMLSELKITYTDLIPDNFCRSLPLEGVEIKNIGSSEVGAYAFDSCYYLESVNIPVAFSKVGSFAFYRTAISEFDATKLAHVGTGAFYSCYSLKNFNLEGNSVLSYIGAGAFYDCYRLENFNLNDKNELAYIGDGAFYGCVLPESVEIPESVEYVGYGAFQFCTGIKEITLPFIGCMATSNAQTLDAHFAFIFGGVSGSEETFVPKSLEKITIKSAAQIYKNAFFGCNNVKEIIIESNYTRIGTAAFKLCRNLDNFVIPSSVVAIDEEAFDYCYKLYEVYNLSGLSIAYGSKIFGGAGYYALKIYKSLTEEKIPKVYAGDCEFMLNLWGEWYLTRYVGTSGNFSPPQSIVYNGARVNSYNIIKYMAESNEVITQAVIPSSVTEIAEAAFLNCNYLRDITVPYIGGSAHNSGSSYFSYIFTTWKGYEYEYELVPDSLKTVTVTGITEVPAYAFYGCSSIKEIRLPSGNVGSIGDNAFYGCTSLEKIVLPQGLSYIGDSAFGSCTSLLSIDVPSTVDYVGFAAFYGCFSIQEMTLPYAGSSKDDGRFLGYLFGSIDNYSNNVPNSLKTVTITSDTAVDNNAFDSCFALTEINLPETVSSIGASAFAFCSGLKSISLPSSLTAIGAKAFYQCVWLESVVVKSRVSIGTDAFYGCTSLYGVYNLSGMALKEGSTDNGYLAYYAVAVLTSLSEKIENVTLNGTRFKRYKNNWMAVAYEGSSTYLTLSSFKHNGAAVSSFKIATSAFSNNSFESLTIGKEVTFIYESAFAYCVKLKTVTFENTSITELSDSAFSNCPALAQISLPQNLQKIGNYAFYNCIQLFALKIPSGVSYIGEGAFYNCHALCDVVNLSALNISAGSTDNGYVGFYALRVGSSSAAALETVESGGCRFVLFGGEWHLASVRQSASLSLPSSFDYKGTKVSAYVLTENAFFGRYLNRVFIPKSVISLRTTGSLTYLDMGSIYYEGTYEEWEELLSTAFNPLLSQKTVYCNSSPF